MRMKKWIHHQEGWHATGLWACTCLQVCPPGAPRVPVLFLAPGFGLTRHKNMSFTGRRILSLHGLRAFGSLVHFASRNFSRRAAALAFAALACLTMFRLRGPCVEGQMEGLSIWGVDFCAGLTLRVCMRSQAATTSLYFSTAARSQFRSETSRQMPNSSNRRLKAQFEGRTIFWRKRPSVSSTMASAVVNKSSTFQAPDGARTGMGCCSVPPLVMALPLRRVHNA